MLTMQYALELGKDGFTVLAISPGVRLTQNVIFRNAFAHMTDSVKWLKTDLGSSYADLEVETGVRAVLQLILGVTPEMNGKFLNIHVPGWEKAAGPNQYDGGEVPW